MHGRRGDDQSITTASTIEFHPRRAAQRRWFAAIGWRNGTIEAALPTLTHNSIPHVHEPSGSGAKQKTLPGCSLNTLMNSQAWPVGLCWVSTGGLIFFDGTITFVPLAI
jgi:hypothetical protein